MDIKPCPFCGSIDIHRYVFYIYNKRRCGGCGADVEAKHWNTRPAEDALAAKLDEVDDWLEETIVGGFETWRLDELREILGGNHD